MSGGEDRYDLVELIGAGGMAEVFRAKMVGAVGFEKLVAIKRLLPHMSSDEEFVQRFIDEARLTARLVHPNICQILDFGVMDDCYFITMEYVDGLDLANLLKGTERDNERIPVDVALSIICGVLRGLKHAHEATDDDGRPLGIVHRDVSPQNVLLSVNGDVKLSDLGAATANAAYRSARTQKNFRLGKVLYMAPEQRRQQGVDARADLYSTGILLAELLLGQGDFHQDANMFLAGMCCLWEKVEERLASPLGEGLARVIERALAEDPSRRFQTADEMLTAIEELLVEYAPGTSVDRVARLVQRLKKRAKRRKTEHLDRPETGPAPASVVSLHTGDVEPLDNPEATVLPDLQHQPDTDPDPDAGLAEAVTTVARSARSAPVTPTELDAPVLPPQPRDYDFDNEATLIHRTAAQRPQPTPLPSELESDPQQQAPGETIEESEDVQPSVVVDDPEELYDPPTRRDSSPFLKKDETPPTETQERRSPLVVGGVIVAAVLVAGLVFGGLLASQLFPDPPAPAPGGEDRDDLISTRPAGEPPSSEEHTPPLAKANVGQSLTPPPADAEPNDSGAGTNEGEVEAGAGVEEDEDGEEESSEADERPRRTRRERGERPHRRDRRDRQARSGAEQAEDRSGHGYLNINSRPYGIPSVDGVPIPAGTPVARYRVSAGTHRVVVRFPQSNTTAERTVRVEAGQTRGVTLTLND